LLDRDDSVSERALRCIRALGQRQSADPIFDAAGKEDDEYLRVEMAEALLELGDLRGVPILIDVIGKGEAAQARRDAWEHLTAHVALDPKLKPELATKTDAAGIAELQKWWDEHKAKLELDHGVFKPKH
jgi:HEAT repeat protein